MSAVRAPALRLVDQAAPYLSAIGLTRRYEHRGAPPVIAVRDVYLDVEPGTSVAIQGPSGSGKTTLLGLLAGLERPDAGTVTVLGHDLFRLTATERARLRRTSMAIVFQSFGLVASVSAGGNVALPLALDGVPEAERLSRAENALADVGLGRLRDARVDELSGGQRQRVAIARALAIDPAIVLADEPTGSVDGESADRIMALLEGLVRDRGASLVLVTHDLASASRADQRYRMRDGRLSLVS